MGLHPSPYGLILFRQSHLLYDQCSLLHAKVGRTNREFAKISRVLMDHALFYFPTRRCHLNGRAVSQLMVGGRAAISRKCNVLLGTSNQSSAVESTSVSGMYRLFQTF